MKKNGIKKCDIYLSNNKDDILLQLKTWVVNEEKYKTLMKTNDDIEEIFFTFLIQHNKNEKSFLIGFYKKVPRLNEIQLIINKAHIMVKSHVPWRATTDMIFKTMNYYWSKMNRECEAMIWVTNSSKAQEKN